MKNYRNGLLKIYIIKFFILIIVIFCINVRVNSQTTVQVGISKTFTNISDTFAGITTSINPYFMYEFQYDYRVSVNSPLKLLSGNRASLTDNFLTCSKAIKIGILSKYINKELENV